MLPAQDLLYLSLLQSHLLYFPSSDLGEKGNLVDKDDVGMMWAIAYWVVACQLYARDTGPLSMASSQLYLFLETHSKE